MFGLFTKLRLFFNDLWSGKPTISDRGDLRSSKWPTVRKHHIAKEPVCQYCGNTDELEVHHMAPFHLHPDRELDDSNLITLCEYSTRECHLKQGHLGNWKEFNPDIRKICDERKLNGFN